MVPKMEKPLKENLLVRFPHSVVGKTEAQKEKTTKSKAGTQSVDCGLGT